MLKKQQLLKTIPNPVRNQVVRMLNVQYVMNDIPSKYEKVTTFDRNLDAIAQVNIQYIETDTHNALEIKQSRVFRIDLAHTLNWAGKPSFWIMRAYCSISIFTQTLER